MPIDIDEVYFTDLRILDSQRLGAVGQGWKVSLTTLMNERLSIGAGIPTGFPELLDLCCRFDTSEGLAIDDSAVRSRLATWAVRTSGLRYTAYRSISTRSRRATRGKRLSVRESAPLRPRAAAGPFCHILPKLLR